MSQRLARLLLLLTFASSLIITACASSEPGKVCAVLDTGGENDKSFNENTLRGAREAALEHNLPFAHIVATTEEDYVPFIDRFVEEQCGLIITVGFFMADATANAARANPDIQFAIVDHAYFPGFGCSESVESCYSDEGGLSNITSLTFAEDEVGYLAGTLAGCMTKSGIIGTVAGMQIETVERYVNGYQNGAHAFNPEVETLNVYIPDFNDPYTGKQEGDRQIRGGADVIFAAGGNTGNGGLVAAHDLGLMAIGVDVDQYFTFPEVADSLLTSAAKNMDVAAGNAVEDYAAGQLSGGIETSTLSSGGVGLAPFHDWDDLIPTDCKTAVTDAETDIKDGRIDPQVAP
jgi:basic membrane protein A